MNLEKFTKNEFGTLTTITNPKTGEVMFIGSEIAKMWGHTNLTQAIKRILNNEEYKKISLKKYPYFKDLLLTNKMLSSSNASFIICLTESAIYKLALSSNLAKAKPFRDWVTSEVLPSIRKHGYYSIANNTQSILMHTNISVQKNNSKDINTKNFIETGIQGVIDYNIKSCVLHTGGTPKEIKSIGIEKGLNKSTCKSAKEVLRNIKPEIACGMSFTDSLVKQGYDLKTVSDLSLKSAIPLFQGMIELGIKPKELTD